MRSTGMGSAIDSAARQVLQAVPTTVWQTVMPKSAIGLCYHVVSDRRLPHLKHYPVLSKTAFEADLDYIQSKFPFLSYETLAARRGAARIRRDNSAILTFDDGFAQCATEVAPILLRRGISCTFFVITDLIDNKAVFRESAASLCIDEILKTPFDQIQGLLADLNFDALPLVLSNKSTSLSSPLEMADLGQRPDSRLKPLLHWLLTINSRDADKMAFLCARLGVDPMAYVRDAMPYLSSAQLSRLHASGFTIGAHSCSHRLLQSLSQEDAEHEIVMSCSIIREITGQRSVPFAFPYSGAGIDRKWLARLRADHEVLGLYFDTNGLREDAPFVVQRAFGERMGSDKTIDAILRRAWARPSAWAARGSNVG